MIEGNNQDRLYDNANIEHNKFQRLYVAVSNTRGLPTLDELKEIIEIVKTDFPPPPNNKDY